MEGPKTKAVQAINLLIYVWEVPVSNLGRYTVYLD
jgi:hypothetical protein